MATTSPTREGDEPLPWPTQVGRRCARAISSAKSIILSGGAEAKNIFWQVAGYVDLGTTSHAEGIMLSETAIHLKTGASINGRLLAQTAVTLDSASVTAPGL